MFELVGFTIALGYLQAFAGAIGDRLAAAGCWCLAWLRRGWRWVIRKLEAPPIRTPADVGHMSAGITFGGSLDLRAGGLEGRVRGLEMDLARLRDEILPAKLGESEARLGARIGTLQRDVDALRHAVEASMRKERRHNVVATGFFTVGLVLSVLANIAGAP